VINPGLVQTDDKLALKEITFQLQLENTVGDKIFVRNI
jgi:origin recognition complex subunit 4